MIDLLAISPVLVDLAIATGLGMLVGLQRQRAQSDLAGIRTFALLTLFGAVSGTLAGAFGGWVLAAGLLAVAGAVLFGDLALLQQAAADGEAPDPGRTTEIAALTMFGIGALLPLGHRVPAIVLGAAVALLLYWKRPLHDLVGRIGEDDVRAIMRLALIALVVLPVLPNRAMGPSGVLNPFEIWLMVVLIVGISLGAYVAYRLLGARVGTLAAGALGGFISSTATTVSYARRSRDQGTTAGPLLVIMVASTTVFVRVLGEIALVAPSVLATTAPPLAAAMGWLVLVSAGVYVRGRDRLDAANTIEQEAPSPLAAAIVFGLLYAVVLLAVATAREHLGQQGLYVVAGLSGLTDMDAITLSTARLMEAGDLSEGLGWRLILVGGMANLVFKGIMVAVLGGAALAREVGVAFGLALGGSMAILMLWPG